MTFALSVLLSVSMFYASAESFYKISTQRKKKKVIYKFLLQLGKISRFRWAGQEPASSLSSLPAAEMFRLGSILSLP